MARKIKLSKLIDTGKTTFTGDYLIHAHRETSGEIRSYVDEIRSAKREAEGIRIHTKKTSQYKPKGPSIAFPVNIEAQQNLLGRNEIAFSLSEFAQDAWVITSIQDLDITSLLKK